MSHFAKVVDGRVVNVIVADQEYIDTGVLGAPSLWVKTSYNTFAGKHREGGTPLRKNYAGIGFAYDPIRDAFISPEPSGALGFDEESCTWIMPPHVVMSKPTIIPVTKL